ncbi:MAG: O-antigen ligase family protein, partial [Bacillota bacterium]
MFSNLDNQVLDKISFYLLIAIIFLVPLIYLPQLESQSGTIYKMGAYDQIVPLNEDLTTKPKFYSLLILEALLLIVFYLKIKKNNIELDWRKEYLPVVVFMGLVCISALLSPYKNIVLYGKSYRHEGVLAFIAYAIVFFSTISIIDTRAKLKKFIKYLFVSGSIIALIGLVQYGGYDLIKLQAEQIRAESTIGNSNFAGSYVSMLFPLSLVIFFYAQSKKELWTLGTVTTLFYSFLVATGTKSSYVALLVVIPLMVYFIYDKLIKHKKRLVALVIVLSLVTILLGQINPNHSWQRFSSLFTDANDLVTGTEEQRNGVGANRMYIYKTTVPLLTDRPWLGSGPDTFQLAYPQEQYREFKDELVILDKAH